MEKKMINLTINGIPACVPEGTTILEAARSIGVRIPSLCYMKHINEIGACRVCVVEVKGMRNLVAHNYGSMSRDIIWETAVNDIPVLRAFCDQQIKAFD